MLNRLCVTVMFVSNSHDGRAAVKRKIKGIMTPAKANYASQCKSMTKKEKTAVIVFVWTVGNAIMLLVVSLLRR